MKPKGLLFALFILYWMLVYGVALLSSDFRNKFRQTPFSQFIPFGYSMFTPMTKTNYDVSYEFYKNGNLIKTISLQDYLNKEFDKGLFHNKTASIKSKIYIEQIYQFDLAFQKNRYAELYKSDKKDFESEIDKDENLKSISENIKKFSKLYISENSFSADSVTISVSRAPMVLPFNPDYKGNFTYHVGDMVFYQKNYVFVDSDND